MYIGKKKRINYRSIPMQVHTANKSNFYQICENVRILFFLYPLQ